MVFAFVVFLEYSFLASFIVLRGLCVLEISGECFCVPLGGDAFRTIEVTLHAAYYWYRR
jgi:hypothetical protein